MKKWNKFYIIKDYEYSEFVMHFRTFIMRSLIGGQYDYTTDFHNFILPLNELELGSELC